MLYHTDKLSFRKWAARDGMSLMRQKKYISFYKREDDIPVLLHIGIQQNVTAQIEYVEAENDAEKYLMLGLIVGRNDKNVEYAVVDPPV